MERCDGPCIIALVSAALARDGKTCFVESDSTHELDDVIRQHLMPPHKLWLDCRGRLNVTQGKSAFVYIGEITLQPH